MKYQYRKIFGLTEKELEEESIDTFYTNLYIHGAISKKQELEARHG